MNISSADANRHVCLASPETPPATATTLYAPARKNIDHRSFTLLLAAHQFRWELLNLWDGDIVQPIIDLVKRVFSVDLV